MSGITPQTQLKLSLVPNSPITPPANHPIPVAPNTTSTPGIALPATIGRVIAAPITIAYSELQRHAADYPTINQFIENFTGDRLSMCEIGLGDGSDTLSLLAEINSNPKVQNNLSNFLDLTLVDIRSKNDIEFITLGNEATQNFFIDTLANQSKTKFSTPIEHFAADRTQGFDIVSFNNVAYYMGGGGSSAYGVENYANIFCSPIIKQGNLACLRNGGFPIHLQHLENVTKLVNPGGLFVMHHTQNHNPRTQELVDQVLNEIPYFKENFTKLKDGVYQRR